MLQFKSVNDLQQLSPSDPAYALVADFIQRLIVNYEAEGYKYDPAGDGWICLLGPEDVDRPITEIWDDWTLLDVPWEGITKQDNFWILVFLANNEFGILFLAEDAPWINGKLRKMLEENLDPPLDQQQTEGVR